MEEWKDIEGYEGLYQVSNQGRVKSLKFGKEKIRKGGKVIRQWASTAECGRNGYSSGAVSECARGVRKQYKGYVWKYLQA